VVRTQRLSDWSTVSEREESESVLETMVFRPREQLFEFLLSSAESGALEVTAPGLSSVLRGDRTPAPEERPAIAFSQTKRRAALVAAADLTVFDIAAETWRTVRLDSASNSPSIAVADDGSTAVIETARLRAKPLLFVSAAGTPITLWEGIARQDAVDDIDITPQGDRIAATVNNGLRTWERSGAAWHERTLGEGRGLVVFDPDGRRVYVDGRVVDVADSRSTRLDQALRNPDAVVFDVTGRYVAASTDRDVRVWDSDTGAVIHVANVLPDGVAFLEFRSDELFAYGRSVARWSLDGVPRLMEVTELSDGIEPPLACGAPAEAAFTGYETDAFPDDWIRPMLGATSEDGGRLEPCVDIEDDGSSERVQVGMRGSGALLWRYPKGDAQARACRIAGRNLSRVEWNEYVGESVPYRETCPGLPVPAARDW
jgi:hypothetical protein